MIRPRPSAWEDAQRQLEEARVRYQQVERLEQQQNQEKATLSQLQQNHRLLQQNKEHLEGLSRQLESRKAELDRASETSPPQKPKLR